MRIDKIWEDLESDNTFNQGLLFKRYSATILPDIFVALKSPERFRCIAVPISDAVRINISSFKNLKEIGIDLITENGGKTFLLVKLLNIEHKDIFSALSEDLIEQVSSFTSEPQLISELLSRFERWKSLFESMSSDGLTPEMQRGLFGELYFLRLFLQSNTEFLHIINSWGGPEKKNRDFEFANWSVEVKTTHGSNHDKVVISSERQLDTNNLQHLFLFHISLEVRHQAGETLNQLTDSVCSILKPDFAALRRFKSKLVEGGYFEHHKSLYDKSGYFIREEFFYEVKNKFPRIEEKDLRRGVENVKYSISLSQCEGFLRTHHDIFKIITFI